VALLSNVHPVLALATYGMWLFLGGVVAVLIWPEMLSKKVPETLEECEKMSSTRNKWLRWRK
jgi:hypothetical protein